MLSQPPRCGVDHYKKKYTYFTKKERPALEGDTFNGCPYPPLQQPCSSFYYITFLSSEYQWYLSSEILFLECIPS